MLRRLFEPGYFSLPYPAKHTLGEGIGFRHRKYQGRTVHEGEGMIGTAEIF